jgi:Aspartyl/Asparaginyl beta-hydroxylase
VEPFVKIAEGLSVAPALAEIARLSDNWVEVNPAPQRFIMILSGEGRDRWLEAELPETWRLIDRLVAIVAGADPERDVRLGSARLGLTPPGGFMPAHHDGTHIDGVSWRRCQIALRSDPGVAFICGGETRRFLPGEAWQFDAGRIHEVRNDSTADRITALVDILTSPAQGRMTAGPEVMVEESV